jgi:hypothetical protein
MKHQILGSCLVLAAIGPLSGCSGSRDVRVSGKVALASSVAEGKPVRVEFYEPKSAAADAGADGAFAFVDAVTLEAAGPFQDTVSVTGDSIHVVAIVDADQNGACTDGEAWGEADVAVGQDDTASATVNVAPHGRCPAVSSGN